MLGDVRNATVSLSAGKWFVSIQTAREVDVPVPHATSAVGIDVGIARFATLSDGTFYAPLNSFRRHETALRKAQQAMSRKVRFSNNWTWSAAGSGNAPGRNVRGRSGLNKAILDQGWAEFRRQLDYKLAWRGEYLVAYRVAP